MDRSVASKLDRAKAGEASRVGPRELGPLGMVFAPPIIFIAPPFDVLCPIDAALPTI